VNSQGGTWKVNINSFFSSILFKAKYGMKKAQLGSKHCGNTFYILFVILYRIYGFKVILYSYLILKKMNEHITDS